MKMRPRSSELLLVITAVLAVVSAGFAVHFWTSRGVCIDSVVCATIAILLIIGMILMLWRMVSVSRERHSSSSPVFLVMKSGPRKLKEEPREIKGKMPEDLDH